MPAFSTSSSNTMGVSQMTVASAMSRARVWPPESSVMRTSRSTGSPVSWLAKSMVRSIMSSGCLPLAARTVAWASRNSPTGRSLRNVVCCVISAIGFFDGSWRYSRGGRSPLIRIRRSDGVSPSANISTSLMSVVLPDPVGPTMLATLPILQFDALDGLRFSVLAAPADDRDALDRTHPRPLACGVFMAPSFRASRPPTEKPTNYIEIDKFATTPGSMDAEAF